jgi:hypothetical protein
MNPFDLAAQSDTEEEITPAAIDIQAPETPQPEDPDFITEPMDKAVQPTLPFTDWLAKNSGRGDTEIEKELQSDPLAKYRGYSAYVRQSTLENGEWDDELIANVDSNLAQLAISAGDFTPADPEAEVTINDVLAKPSRDELPLDSLLTYANVAEQDELSLARRDSVAQLIALKQNPELATSESLVSAEAAVREWATPEVITQAAKQDVRNGRALAKLVPPPIEGGAPEVVINESLYEFVREDGSIDDQGLGRAIKFSGVDPNLIPEIRYKLSTPAGYNVPVGQMEKQGEFVTSLDTVARTKDAEGQFKVYEEMERITRATLAGSEYVDKFGMQRLNTLLKGTDFWDNASAEERRAYVNDYVLANEMPEIDKENPSAAIRTLSTGERVTPLNLMLDDAAFDKAVNSDAVPPEQRDRLRRVRDAQVEANAQGLIQTITESPQGGSAFLRYMEEQRESGKKDSEIVRGWVSAGNFSPAGSTAIGMAASIKDAVLPFVHLVAPKGSSVEEFAMNAMIDSQKADASRRAYANLFGYDHGIGYDLGRLVAPVAADLAVARLTGGASIGATAGARAIAGTALKSMMRESLSAGSKTMINSWIKSSAAAGAKSVGTKVTARTSVDEIISLTGRDISNKIGTVGSFAGMQVTAANRSATMTYASLSTALSNERNPDGSAKYTQSEVKEIAMNHSIAACIITAAVVGGFSILGRPGVEMALQRGLTKTQLNRVWSRLSKDVKALPSNIDMTSANAMLTSLVKQSLVPLMKSAAVKGFADEAMEEGLESVLQSFNEAHAMGERVDIGETLRGAVYEGFLGGIMGGTIAGGSTALRNRRAVNTNLEADMRRSKLLEVASTLDATSPQTAQVLRNYAVNQRRLFPQQAELEARLKQAKGEEKTDLQNQLNELQNESTQDPKQRLATPATQEDVPAPDAATGDVSPPSSESMAPTGDGAAEVESPEVTERKQASATRLASALANAYKIDIATIQGSGKNGAVTPNDVRRVASALPARTTDSGGTQSEFNFNMSPEPTLRDTLGKRISYEGYEGTVIEDEGRLAVQTDDGRIVELPVSSITDEAVSTLGITVIGDSAADRDTVIRTFGETEQEALFNVFGGITSETDEVLDAAELGVSLKRNAGKKSTPVRDTPEFARMYSGLTDEQILNAEEQIQAAIVAAQNQTTLSNENKQAIIDKLQGDLVNLALLTEARDTWQLSRVPRSSLGNAAQPQVTRESVEAQFAAELGLDETPVDTQEPSPVTPESPTGSLPEGQAPTSGDVGAVASVADASEPTPLTRETLTPKQAKEVEVFEELRLRKGQKDNGVKGVKFTKTDQTKFDVLGKKYRSLFVESVNPQSDPVVGVDINGTNIQRSSQGTLYTFENGRVRTGPAITDEAPTPTSGDTLPGFDMPPRKRSMSSMREAVMNKIEQAEIAAMRPDTDPVQAEALTQRAARLRPLLVNIEAVMMAEAQEARTRVITPEGNVSPSADPADVVTIAEAEDVPVVEVVKRSIPEDDPDIVNIVPEGERGTRWVNSNVVGSQLSGSRGTTNFAIRPKGSVVSLSDSWNKPLRASTYLGKFDTQEKADAAAEKAGALHAVEDQEVDESEGEETGHYWAVFSDKDLAWNFAVANDDQLPPAPTELTPGTPITFTATTPPGFAEPTQGTVDRVENGRVFARVGRTVIPGVTVIESAPPTISDIFFTIPEDYPLNREDATLVSAAVVMPGGLLSAMAANPVVADAVKRYAASKGIATEGMNATDLAVVVGGELEADSVLAALRGEQIYENDSEFDGTTTEEKVVLARPGSLRFRMNFTPSPQAAVRGGNMTTVGGYGSITLQDGSEITGLYAIKERPADTDVLIEYNPPYHSSTTPAWRIGRVSSDVTELPPEISEKIQKNLADARGWAVFSYGYSKIPFNAEAVETYGIKLPEGYVKQGDLYVFQPDTPRNLPSAPLAAITEQDKVGKPEMMPQVNFFYTKPRYGNIRIKSPVGEKFSAENLQHFKDLGDQNGWTVYGAGEGSSDVEFGISARTKVKGEEGVRMLEDTLEAMKSETQRDKLQREKDENFEKEKSNQEAERRVFIDSYPKAKNWIDTNFGEGNLNSANRVSLIRYLEGLDRKYKGAVNRDWEQGLRKLESVSPDGNVDWGKLKKSYQGFTDTPRNLPSSTPSSAVTKELNAFGFDQGLPTFLANVAKRGGKAYSGLAKLLLDAGAGNVEIRLVNLPNTEAAGFYVGANGVVHINTAKSGPRGAVDTVLHELVHAVTEGSLRNPTPEQAKVIARIERVRATVTKRAKANGTFNDDLQYALGDNAEFLTHFFTSQRFRDQVSAMTPKSEKNWLMVIADLIADLFTGRTKAQKMEVDLRKELTTLITAPRIGLAPSDVVRNLPSKGAANVARFHQLTESLYRGRDEATAAEIEAWKAENPEKWEELSAMREEVLRAGGWDVKAFHGTPTGGFTEFKEGVAFFSADDGVAQTYGETMAVFLKTENPATFDFGGKSTVTAFGENLRPSQLAAKVRGISQDLDSFIAIDESVAEELTYAGLGINETPDTVVMENIDDSMEVFSSGNVTTNYAVLNPSQVKSAEPISPGKKLTPDRWADAVSPDIRFQPAARPAPDFAAAEQQFNNQVNEYVTGNWPSDTEGRYAELMSFAEQWAATYTGITVRVADARNAPSTVDVNSGRDAVAQFGGDTALKISQGNLSETEAKIAVAHAVNEEVIHVAHLNVVLERLGEDTTYGDVAEEVKSMVRQMLAHPSKRLRDAFASAAYETYISYTGQPFNQGIADDPAAVLLAAIDMKDSAAGYSLGYEMVRQAVQMRVFGATTENVRETLLGRIIEFFQDRLKAIRRLASNTRVLGERFSKDIIETEAAIRSLRGDIRFQPAARNTDADYLAAVEAGDMETAQKMVDEAQSLKIPNTGIEVIPSTNIDRIIAKLAEIVGDADDRAVGLRSIYASEVGVKDLPNSFYRNENSDILDELSGVSTYRVSPDFEFGFPDFKTEKDWLRKALKESKQAGDQPFLALVVGDIQTDEIFADPHEQVIGSPEVIAYIPRPTDPVTYDTDGNVIPLSQRFQSSSPNIRFQGLTEQDFTPASIIDTATGFLPDDVAFNELRIDAAQLADDVTDLDPVNAENYVRAAVNHALARRAGEAAIPAPVRSEFDSDEAFAAATDEHTAEVAQLTDTFELITRGRLSSADMLRYRTNPSAMKRLISYLTEAITSAYNRFTARPDTATAVLINRMSRDLGNARGGFNQDIESSRGYDREILFQPAATSKHEALNAPSPKAGAIDLLREDAGVQASADKTPIKNSVLRWLNEVFLTRHGALAQSTSNAKVNRDSTARMIEVTVESLATKLNKAIKTESADAHLVQLAMGNVDPLISEATEKQIVKEYEDEISAAEDRIESEVAKIEDPKEALAYRREKTAEAHAEVERNRKARIWQARYDAAEERRAQQISALTDLERTAPDTYEAVIDMRAFLNDLQRRVKAMNGDSPELQAIIDQSESIYLVRSYGVHQDPKQIDMMMNSQDPEYVRRREALTSFFATKAKEIIAKELENDPEFLSSLKGEYDFARVTELLEAEAESRSQARAVLMFEDFMTGHQMEGGTFGGGSDVSNEIARYMKKVNMPQEFLDALMVNEDPVFNAVNTGLSLGRLIVNANMLSEIATSGIESGRYISAAEKASGVTYARGRDVMREVFAAEGNAEVKQDVRDRLFIPLFAYYKSAADRLAIPEMLTPEEVGAKLDAALAEFGKGGTPLNVLLPEIGSRADRMAVDFFIQSPKLTLSLKDKLMPMKGRFANWQPLVSPNEGNSAYAPLGGLYAAPDEVEVFRATFHTSRQADMNSAQKAIGATNKTMIKLAGWSLLVATAGSPSYYVRNVFGGMFYAGINGVNFADPRLLRAASQFMFQTGTSAEITQEFQELIAGRIVMDGAKIGYLRQLFEDMQSNPSSTMEKISDIAGTADKNLASAFKRGKKYGKAFINKLGDFAEITEVYPAVMTYLDFKTKLEEAQFGTEREIQQEAIRLTKRVMPSKSEASSGVAAFTQSGLGALLAPFIRFKAEVIRNVVNSARVAHEWSRSDNPVLQKYGRRKMAAWGIVAGGLTVSMPIIVAKVLQGIGDEEEEAIRASLPTYLQNASLYYYVGEDGVKIFNLTYTNPLSFALDPISRAASAIISGDPEEIPLIMGRFLAEDLIGENIVASNVLDAVRNKDSSTGRPVYFESDSEGVKYSKQALHMLRSYNPRLFVQANRFIEAAQRDTAEADFFYTPLGVAAVTVAPFRPITASYDDMERRAFNAIRKENSELWMKTSRVFSPMPLSAKEAVDAYEDRTKAIRNQGVKTLKLVEGFTALREKGGAGSQREVIKSMVNSGISKRRANTLVRGNAVERLVFPDDEMRKLRATDPERHRALVDAIRKQPSKIPLDKK